MVQKLLTIFLVLVLLSGVSYMSVYIWIGITVSKIVDYANMSEGCYPLVADQVSEELFHRLNHRCLAFGPSDSEREEYPYAAHEVFTRTFPISTHNFSTATSVYRYTYTYEGYSADGEKWDNGSWNVPVTIALVREGLKWVIVETNEDP